METVWLALVGLAAGALSVLCGVGGGIVVVPALVWIKDWDVKKAVATSLAFIVPTAIVGVLRKPASLVDYRIAAVLAAGAVAGAFFGEYASAALPSLWVKRIFAVVLAVVAVRLFWETT
jgi:uncharacterized membrane protein YfcA